MNRNSNRTTKSETQKMFAAAAEKGRGRKTSAVVVKASCMYPFFCPACDFEFINAPLFASRSRRVAQSRKEKSHMPQRRAVMGDDAVG